jgi:glyoxylase-like metal-dependent hydrolase (beta-lactamase superfamily II)
VTIKLYALTCGWLTGPLDGFLAGESGRLRVPVPCFVVDHPRGKVLFDTGMHVQTQTDPKARLGWMADVFDVEFHPGEEIAARLAHIDIDATCVDYLINSHLHFDHVGGNHAIINAQVIVQRAEWQAGRDSDLIQSNGYNRADYDLGHDVHQVDGEYDLFGDGTVVCIPTYGHTPGHQSLRVRLGKREVILASDACYLRRTLEQLHLPSVVHNAEMMLGSLERLRELQAAGAEIFYGHDPEFWATVPQAPVAIA